MKGEGRTAALVLSVAVTLAVSAVPEPARPLPTLADALEGVVDGARVLGDVTWLSGYNRVQPSDEFNRAAAALAAAARQAGLEQIEVLSYPADGRTYLGTYRALPAWDATRGTLDLENPDGTLERIADFAAMPVALAAYSRSAKLTAALVDVGAGDSAAAYVGRDVKGAVVLASGSLPVVQREAVFARGAAGIVSSDYIGPPSNVGGEKERLVGWGQNHQPSGPRGEASTFAFMVAPSTAERLRDSLTRGAGRVRVDIEARVHEGTYQVVTGVIRGTRPEAGEFLLTAHLDHAAPSAEDDASGCAVNLEVARALVALHRAGKLAAPERALRFLWGPEVVGTIAYLTGRGENAGPLVAAFHQDMVGASYRRTGSILRFARTPDWQPSALDGVVSAAAQEIAARSREASPGGRAASLLAPGGDDDAFLYEVIDYERGGDDYVLVDSSFGIPTAHAAGWPYHRIHTDQDRPEFLDATRLGRQAALVSLIAATMASADPALWESFVPKVLGDELAGLGRAVDRPAALRLKAERARRSLASLEALALGAPSVTAAVERARRRLLAFVGETGGPAPRGPGGRLVARRVATLRGPLRLFFFDYLAARLGPDWTARSALVRNHPGDGQELAYRVLAFVDGRRNVAEIADAVSGLAPPVAEPDVLDHLRLLEMAGVLHLEGPPG